MRSSPYRACPCRDAAPSRAYGRVSPRRGVAVVAHRGQPPAPVSFDPTGSRLVQSTIAQTNHLQNSRQLKRLTSCYSGVPYLSVAPYPLCIRCPRWPAALVNTLSTVTSPPAVACLNTTIKPTDQPTLTGSPSDGGLGNDTFIVKRFHTEFDLTVEFTYEVQRRLGDHCPSVQRPVAYCPNGNHVHRHNPAGILGLGLSLAGAFLSPRFMRIVPHRVPCWC